MPKITIMFDRSIPGVGQKLAPFWVRVETPNKVEIVEIDAVSLPEAVRKTVAKGLVPTAWNDGSRDMEIPSGLHHMLPQA